MPSPSCEQLFSFVNLFGTMLRHGRLVDLQRRVALGGFYRDHFLTISSRISMVAT